jgi:hypothetical protein
MPQSPQSREMPPAPYVQEARLVPETVTTFRRRNKSPAPAEVQPAARSLYQLRYLNPLFRFLNK